jgi:MFS family permease
MRSSFWVVVVAAAASISLSLGIRQTFGLFVLPLAQDGAVAASLIGASVALHNLAWGISQPVFGALGDRYGAGKVVMLGGLLLFAGLGMVAAAPSAFTVILGIGLLSGFGVAGAGTGAALAAVGRAVPMERRGELIGLAAAGGSLGQAAMAPIAAELIGAWGGLWAFGGMAALALLILPVGRVLEWRPIPGTKVGGGLAALPALAQRALAQRDFALLTAGYFACGFQLAFLTVHLPTHLSLCGMPEMGAMALLTIGLFNVPGSWLCGRVGNVMQPEHALGIIYLLRSVAIACFTLVTPTPVATYIFAAVMGFVWLGTVPLTNTAIARRFGVADLGALTGVCFLSHQLGGFLGAASGAVLLETVGNFDAFWPVMIAVGLGATAVNWMARPPARALA